MSREKKIEKYVAKVQPLIEHCNNCQPYDEGEVVWIHGDRTSLTDLFFDLDIPENFYEDVAFELQCPGCGTELEIWYDVGLKTKFEKELEEHYDNAYRKHGKEVKEFNDYIISFPLLAMNNDFGKLIYAEIESGKFGKVALEGLVFRSRKVRDSQVLNANDMMEPPIGKSPEGRFNHSGQSLLYCTPDMETALYETADRSKSTLVWLQKFQVKTEVTNILDLTSDWTMMSTATSAILIVLREALGRKGNNVELFRPDYYVTRFISDCARNLGYAGIKFSSIHTGMDNFVLFDTCKNLGLTPLDDPYIETVPSFESEINDSFGIEDFPEIDG